MNRSAAAFCTLTLALAAPHASAQTRDTLARRDSAPVVLAPLTVRASIAPTAGPAVGSTVPARITVVAGRELDAQRAPSLTDVLRGQPGIALHDDLGSAHKINLGIRGFDVGPTVGIPAGVSVFLDGVRQNEPDAQEVSFDLLPMDDVERVEVLSGTASLLGPNSLGGAINLVTRRGSAPGGSTVELSGGSFGAASGEASTSGLGRAGWDYYLGGGAHRERGWRAATGASGADAVANLGRRGETRGFSVQGHVARSRAETAGSLPESIFGVAPATNFTGGDYEDLDAEQVALSGYAPLGAGRASLTTFARRSGAERLNVNQAPDDAVRSFTTNLTGGATADWRWSAAMHGAPVALRVGLDGAVNRVHARIRVEPPAGGSGADSVTTDIRSPSWDLAAYSIADVRLGRVLLSGGARYDYVRLPFQNLLDPASDTASAYRRLDPRGGVSVDLGAGRSVYASVGESFRAPALLELACADPEAACPLPFALGDDPPLRPVRATTYEVGGGWAVGPAVVTATAYRTEVRDEIFFVASESARLAGYFTNLPRTRRDGAELSARAGWLDEALVGYASVTMTRATFRAPASLFSVRAEPAFAGSPLAGGNDVAVGDRLPLVPAAQLKAGAMARLPHGVDIALDWRLVGPQWMRGDEANETRPLDTYAVTGGRIAVRRGSWDVALRGSNLFDSHRATFGTFNENRQTGMLERFLTPLDARTISLVVGRRFGGAEPDGS